MGRPSGAFFLVSWKKIFGRKELVERFGKRHWKKELPEEFGCVLLVRLLFSSSYSSYYFVFFLPFLLFCSIHSFIVLLAHRRRKTPEALEREALEPAVAKLFQQDQVIRNDSSRRLHLLTADGRIMSGRDPPVRYTIPETIPDKAKLCGGCF